MWTLWLLAATVRSFAHMPLGISNRNSSKCLGGLYNVISWVKTLLNFDSIYDSRNMIESRILKLKKFLDVDPDPKILKQERSRRLKMWLQAPSLLQVLAPSWTTEASIRKIRGIEVTGKQPATEIPLWVHSTISLLGCIAII